MGSAERQQEDDSNWAAPEEEVEVLEVAAANHPKSGKDAKWVTPRASAAAPGGVGGGADGCVVGRSRLRRRGTGRAAFPVLLVVVAVMAGSTLWLQSPGRRGPGPPSLSTLLYMEEVEKGSSVRTNDDDEDEDDSESKHHDDSESATEEFSASCRDAFLPFSPAFSDKSSVVRRQQHPQLPSFRAVWERTVRVRARGAALDYERNRPPPPKWEWPNNLTRANALVEFEAWLGRIDDFHTHERLRRSVMHPAPDRPARRLWEIVHKRRGDPNRNDPVRVLVLGGSVVSGATCSANPVGLPVYRQTNFPDPKCSWPARMEHLLNSALFLPPPPGGAWKNSSSSSSKNGGDGPEGPQPPPPPLFQVMNAAKAGTNSRVGSMLLEYQLLPWVRTNVPDVVVLGFSANDAMDPDTDETFARHLPALVRAAHNLRPCDDDLPLVVLADDLYGNGGRFPAAIHQTGSLYKTAAWYDLMAVSYGTVGRLQAVSAYRNSTSVNAMHGSNFDIHLGMGYHIAMALTMLYNFAAALHSTCESILWDKDLQSADQRRTVPPAENGSTLLGRGGDYDEPHPKVRGRYGTIDEVRRDWEGNVRDKERLCRPSADDNHNHNPGPWPWPSPSPSAAARKWSKYSTPVCEYAWMLNPSTGVFSVEALTDAVTCALTNNDGWSVPDARPRYLAWQVASGGGSNSTNRFELTLSNVTMPTRYLTVVSMRSYSKDWVGTTLKVSVEVKRATSGGETAGAAAVWEVSGYHDIKTSVYFPNKFEIPGGGADVGDTVRAVFELVEGSTFKIGGLALCQR